MNKEFLKNFVVNLGFNLIDGMDLIYSKIYTENENYEIQVDLSYDDIEKCKINYVTKNNGIKLGRMTTSNFSQMENLVVLECVNRLLEKGYKPNNIELEKNWRVGGYLDIAVYDTENKLYLMIECKTWGQQYNKALKYMLENNPKQDQLFNYYLQDKDAKYLVLYTSRINENGKFIYKNDIISTEKYKECNNINDIYILWDNTFESKGIFEKHILPYNAKFIGIQKGDLIPLSKIDVEGSEDVDGTIYNRFAEILRRHTVSDKTNAYNKIFNLFLCKIVDEDSTVNEDDEMQFQWKEKETPKQVLNRLNDLYKIGMNDYLKLEIADISDDDINRELGSLGEQVDTSLLREFFNKLRLYKSGEFAFKEVIDENTFTENAIVVKEVVKLLEPYQLKYQNKFQFLGDFFEKLLNIGVKQESGQFFTPIPIANYISYSIPFEEIIENKIVTKEQNFLPYVIDYACGSGHFLTETMERIDNILQSIDISSLKTKPQKDNINIWKIAYKWASEFIYGIEKDYRLAKTTKVACFLNGDGDAQIINADGLDSFCSSSYTGILRNEKNEKTNEVFDVLVANPPYSIENFKFTLKNGKNDFALYDKMTDKSDDIECLFVERMNQLLKVNGYVGIILPRTILLNKSHQQRAREIILKFFEIKGITVLGKNTFAATGTQTAILFLKKRDSGIYLRIEKIVSNFLKDFNDCSFNNTEKIFEKYFDRINLDITYEEYKEKIENDSKFKKIEKEKMIYFLLTFNQKVVIVHTGETIEEEKTFLGYEHSTMKKYEGIHPYPYNIENKIISKLYDEDSLYNNKRANYYILKNFKGELENEIAPELNDNLKIDFLHEMLDFEDTPFEFKIYTEKLNNPYLNCKKYELYSLKNKNIAKIRDGERKPIRKSQRAKGNIPYYGATGISGYIDRPLFNEKLVLIGEDGAKWRKYENTAYIIEGKSWVNNHAHVVEPNEKFLVHEYLMYIFNYLDFSYLKARPNGGKLQQSDLINIKFPLPDVPTQNEIIGKMSKIKNNEKYQILEEYLF